MKCFVVQVRDKPLFAGIMVHVDLRDWPVDTFSMQLHLDQLIISWQSRSQTAFGSVTVRAGSGVLC